MSALRSAAARLEEAGLAGWSIHLDVQPPHVTSHSLGGFPEQSCRLVARCRAGRGNASIDLGSIEAVNSQGDRATACEAAAEDLGKSVAYKLASVIRKEVK
ncbi:MAG TPA: hypothetical protein VGS22_29760 [Thermoanaerobaculia bacterium]|nr:hypothetical protein [Thermoanaerobaculia bacterium]